MSKAQIQYTDNHQAALVKILRAVGYRHGPWQVFRDFVAMGAIALSNATDLIQQPEREAEYLKIVARYSKVEASELARGFAHVVMALEAGMCDFLGALYMRLELGDAWKGQYFTPYEVCRLMAAVTLGEQASQEVEKKGFVTVCDPCVGGGAMVIAAAHALLDAKINYQQHMHAVAVDIDMVSVHMAYIQLSLLHIPAVIYHGNSLSLEVWSVWRTPAHTLGFWDAKLHRTEASCAEFRESGIGEPGEMPLVDLDAVEERVSAVLVLRAYATASITVRDQMTLF